MVHQTKRRRLDCNEVKLHQTMFKRPTEECPLRLALYNSLINHALATGDRLAYYAKIIEQIRSLKLIQRYLEPSDPRHYNIQNRIDELYSIRKQLYSNIVPSPPAPAC